MLDGFLLQTFNTRNNEPLPLRVPKWPKKACRYPPAVITKYQKRNSGPILDRIDIHVEVPRVDYEKLSGNRVGDPVRASGGDSSMRPEIYDGSSPGLQPLWAKSREIVDLIVGYRIRTRFPA